MKEVMLEFANNKLKLGIQWLVIIFPLFMHFDSILADTSNCTTYWFILYSYDLNKQTRVTPILLRTHVFTHSAFSGVHVAQHYVFCIVLFDIGTAYTFANTWVYPLSFFWCPCCTALCFLYCVIWYRNCLYFCEHMGLPTHWIL
jgi:hypothetical protein